MAADWHEVTLSDLTAPGSPITYGVVKPGPVDPSGVLFIRGGDIADGRVLVDQLRTIGREVSAPYRRTLLHGGELIVSLVGNPGQVAIVPQELRGANIARQVGLIRLRVDVDARFVKYSLSSAVGQASLGAHSMGSVQQVINLRDLRTVQLRLPPLSEQRRIAHILGTLDEKIELNRRMNETLEAIARTLFKSWFVDFGPVRAKSEGRDPQLPPNFADLFPDTFEDSELGEIPTGWRVISLDEIATYLNGLALQKYPPDDSGSLPVIKIAQLRAGQTEGADRASAEIPRAYVVEDGDVLFSWSGSLEVGIWCGGSGALNQHLFKVTSDRYPKWLYYLWTLSHLDDFRRTAAGKATTMGHIQRGHLAAAKAVLPPVKLIELMTQIFDPLIADLIVKRLESRTLASHRDALLPKLVSGELRVQVADPYVGERA